MKPFNQAIKTLARNGWTVWHGLALAGLMGLAIALTWSAWAEMFGVVVANDYARTSILVLPIVVWLVWVRRSRFRFVRPRGPGIGLIVLISGIHLYVAGQYLYELRTAWYFGALLVVLGAGLVVTGRSVIQQFLPVWAILPLLVPVPETVAMLIAEPIQILEARSIEVLYGLLGINVEVFSWPGSNRIVVGRTSMALEEVCKGLPTILSLMLISYGFVFGSPMRPVVRMMLLLLAPVVAILCSAISLGGTLWLYDGRSTLMTADLIRALSEWATVLIAFLLIAMSLKVLTWASVPVHQYHLASTST